MSITEKEAEILHAGNRASVAKAYYEEELMLKRERVISDLCALYRARDLELSVLCGKIGELVLIEDILGRFDKALKKAQQVEGKIYDNGNS